MNSTLAPARWAGLALAAMIAAGPLSGCRSSTPATLTLGSGQVLRGSATTSLNGQYFVTDGKVTCNGTFEGHTLVGVGLSFKRKSEITASCSDGKLGSSPELLLDNNAATITFRDGTKGRLQLAE